MAPAPRVHHFKIVLLGDSSVGKRSVCPAQRRSRDVLTRRHRIIGLSSSRPPTRSLTRLVYRYARFYLLPLTRTHARTHAARP